VVFKVSLVSPGRGIGSSNGAGTTLSTLQKHRYVYALNEIIRLQNNKTHADWQMQENSMQISTAINAPQHLQECQIISLKKTNNAINACKDVEILFEDDCLTTDDSNINSQEYLSKGQPQV